MLEIGISGTFDVQNFGDLLFPLIAEAELARRLGPINLHRFSYSAKRPPDWPYPVISITELPKMVARLDGLLIGGGHLIRFDKSIAPGYQPPSADIHHPTGYWLMPALFALQRGCTVVWNAPGGVGDVPAWAEPLMQTAIEHSSYVAVRDEPSRDTLLAFANGKDICVVPDTGFGISRIVDQRRPSDSYSRLRENIGLARPYIIVQAQDSLAGFSRFVQRHRERFAGYQFVSLPIGPILGDHDAMLGEFKELVRLPSWPDPLLIAELIAGASGVVGVSLHLAITALSFGLPMFRPRSGFEGKFKTLSQYETVHSFPDDGDIDPIWFEQKLEQRGLGSKLPEVFRALDLHWDTVAACFSASHKKPVSVDVFGPLVQRLPGLLETDACLQRLQDLLYAQHLTISTRDRHIASMIQTRGEEHPIREEETAMSNTMNARLSDHTVPPTELRAPASVDRMNAVIAERNHQISVRDATISARDGQIAQLMAVLGERDHQIEQLNVLGQARDAQVRALHQSTSWRVTAPLRWAGNLARGRKADTNIIRVQRLHRQALNKEPYHWAFVNGLFAPRDAQSLVKTYPRDHFKTVKGYDGEKGYEYEARAMIHLGANSPSFPEELSSAWSRLANDLLSPAYRAAVTRLTGRDLMSAPMEAYVCHFGPGAWLGPHLDLKDKIMTHVFYFNESWNPKDGGCLNILRSSDMADSIAEISPIIGNSSVLLRANNSWHSVSRVVNGCRTSRRSMNVIFYHPGAVSTMWPPGDTTPLHRYEPAEV